MAEALQERASGVAVRRLPLKLSGDERRVILLPFGLGERRQVEVVLEQVGRLSDEEVSETLAAIVAGFGGRHEGLEDRFEEHGAIALGLLGRDGEVSAERRRLMGAYLTMEYSIEGAALLNPSVVPHPDQSGLPEGWVRFLLSLRATGEGHVSSVVFRTGTIDADHNVRLDRTSGLSARTRLAPDQRYHRDLFGRKLGEMGVNMSLAGPVLRRLGEGFTLAELETAVDEVRRAADPSVLLERALESVLWLARSNYELQLAAGASLSDLIIFPHSDNESRGIEDVRLVRFADDDGSVRFYGTYTAINGVRMLPMLLETTDFRRIQIHTLNGACVQNKGMALFPRRIGGHYAMCSRIDGRNLFLMFSDYVYFWESARLLATPKYPWELRLMGNCGSPIETREGWVLLTHGVGPMRRYCIGAMLLDRDDPFKIRGRLRQPLISPVGEEREGYVPNVVYSCGSMVHRGRLYLPYAMSDTSSTMGTLEMDELLDRLLRDGP